MIAFLNHTHMIFLFDDLLTDAKDFQLQEQRRRNEMLEESIADYETTVGQFRELVLSLQRYYCRPVSASF